MKSVEYFERAISHINVDITYDQIIIIQNTVFFHGICYMIFEEKNVRLAYGSSGNSNCVKMN